MSNPVTWVTLTPVQRQAALEWAQGVMTVLQARGGANYTGLEAPEAYFHGRLGELALGEWAMMHRLWFEDTTRNDGRSDGGSDIRLAIHNGTSHAATQVDVKTSFHPAAKYLMIPVKQYERYHPAIYVGATGTDLGPDRGARVGLHGAITRELFDQWSEVAMVRVQTRQLELKRLPMPMFGLAGICASG